MRKDGALRQWYKRIKRRRGVGIARVAVMRKLATIFRYLVSQGKTYGDCHAPAASKRAERPNHVWSYDLLEDRTEANRKLRLLAVIDEFTRESLAIEVDWSISRRKCSTCCGACSPSAAPRSICGAITVPSLSPAR